MTIGNFSPVLGSTGSDSLQANNLEIIYGLSGDDNLSSIADFAPEEFSVLVGGEGNDQYSVPTGTSAIILDDGSPDDIDRIVFGGTSAATSLFTTVDNNSHIYIFDPDTNSNLLILNYTDAENVIEEFEYADGSFFGNELAALGELEDVDIPLEQLQIETSAPEGDDSEPVEVPVNSIFDAIGIGSSDSEPEPEPEPDPEPETETQASFLGDAVIDFDALGLSIDGFEGDVEEIIDTETNFQNTVVSTDDGSQPNLAVTGTLEEDDNSYTFEGGQYFSDLYSLDPQIYSEGDEVDIELTSPSFGTAVFLLDSRGDVVEFASDSDGFDDAGNSLTNLSFTVPSAEPLFVSVESINPGAVGNYDLSIAGGTPLETIPDPDPVDQDPNISRPIIQANDTVAGEISTDDEQLDIDGNIFFTDGFIFDADASGEVRVTLDSEFDGVIFVDETDAAGNTNTLLDVDDFAAGAVEEAVFSLTPGNSYRLFVDTFEPEETGSYTLTTEVIGEATTNEEVAPEEVTSEIEDSDFSDLTIQTTDTIAEELSADDFPFDAEGGLFFNDLFLLEGETAGEVRVTLESDFDGLISITELDENGEVVTIADIDDRFADGIEEGTFTFEPGNEPAILVTSFEPEAVGDYILTTEFLG